MLNLTVQIANARGAGQTVPCTEGPALFDDPEGPAHLCLECPVLLSCEAYRQTGAVTHGILAGGPAVRRKSRPTSRRDPAPADDPAQAREAA